MVRSRLTVLPTSWLVAGCRLREPGGRPGPGRLGFGARAGSGVFGRMLRNPRRTRAGVSRPGRAGRSQGRRRSAASGAGQAELGVRGDDQPGPAVGGGGVAELRAGPAEGLLEQPEGVFEVEAAQERLPASGRRRPRSASVVEVHSQTGLGSRSPGRCSTCSRIRVPSMIGSSPSWSSQQPRWVSRGWTRSQAGRDRGAVAGGVGGGGVLRGRARWRVGPGRTRGPCLRWAAGRARQAAAASGRRRTRSERSRPTSSTGRSARTKASRVTS